MERQSHNSDEFFDSDEKNKWQKFEAYEKKEEDKTDYKFENEEQSQDESKKVSPKVVFGFLLFLTLVVIGFGLSSLIGNIYRPTNEMESKWSEEQTVEETDVVGDLLEMQNMDTDKDGLSDYDEMYLYGTSPYLADTDSDGYLDKQEIDGGYDPLCPKGEDCRGVTDDGSVDADNELVSEPEQTETGSTELPDEVVEELKNLTPDEIRQLLLESGEMTEEQANQLDDEILLQILNEVLEEGV